jgi:UV DNA damage repair endonuclease
MIKVGDLVKVREGGDLDCAAFDGEVGLVLDIEHYDCDELRDDELLVEWCGRPLALWENPEHLEKCCVD